MELAGFKGFFVKRILPYIIRQLIQMVIEMTPALRKELVMWVKDFRNKSEATDNPNDDYISIFLMKILGH